MQPKVQKTGKIEQGEGKNVTIQVKKAFFSKPILRY